MADVYIKGSFEAGASAWSLAVGGAGVVIGLAIVILIVVGLVFSVRRFASRLSTASLDTPPQHSRRDPEIPLLPEIAAAPTSSLPSRQTVYSDAEGK